MKLPFVGTTIEYTSPHTVRAVIYGNLATLILSTVCNTSMRIVCSSDTGVRGPEHFAFAELLNMAAYVGNTSPVLAFHYRYCYFSLVESILHCEENKL